jgi:type VI protein secretion system component Hcp
MAIDAFLEIEGVKGESLDEYFRKQSKAVIEIHSFDLGGTFVGETHDKKTLKKMAKAGRTPQTGEGARSTKDIFSFSVSKHLDSASTDLLKNYAQTRSKSLSPFKSAKVHLRKTGDKNFFYLVLEFTEVYVVGYEMELDDPATNTPTESLQFCFSSCKITYRPQKQTGGRDAPIGPMGWDFKTNQKL